MHMHEQLGDMMLMGIHAGICVFLYCFVNKLLYIFVSYKHKRESVLLSLISEQRETAEFNSLTSDTLQASTLNQKRASHLNTPGSKTGFMLSCHDVAEATCRVSTCTSSEM